VLRVADYWLPGLNSDAWKRKMQSKFDHHGGEAETSVLLALRPDLVRMDYVTAPGNPRGRLSHLREVRTGIEWYADFPKHYAGDAVKATAAKGEFLLDRMCDRITAVVRAVKRDAVAPMLEKEYFKRTTH
jgi:creatinine amidohydrolase